MVDKVTDFLLLIGKLLIVGATGWYTNIDNHTVYIL